jgi:hypothetical protein
VNTKKQDMKSVKLDSHNYHRYLEGSDVHCRPKDALQEGEHVLVFKDTVGVNTGISPPRSEKLSDNIGVEGMVTARDEQAGVTLRKL